MLPFEGLVIAYLIVFVVAAPFTGVERRRWARTAIVAGVAAIGVFTAVRTLPITARLWLPFLYIPLGYWIPVPLVPPRIGTAFEAWLRRSDVMLRQVALSVPGAVAYAAEVGYLFCFPLVPVAFAVVWNAGTSADVARFWTAVLAAGYACYITLPWLVSRPPRFLEAVSPDGGATSVRQANVFVLRQVSHHLNTFPSGHVAVSVAAAISAGMLWPLAGALLAIVAAGVALGAISGRYHYIVDVLLGVGIGVATSAL
jgi:membrane-associated phospholipid phosphatase